MKDKEFDDAAAITMDVIDAIGRVEVNEATLSIIEKGLTSMLESLKAYSNKKKLGYMVQAVKTVEMEADIMLKSKSASCRTSVNSLLSKICIRTAGKLFEVFDRHATEDYAELGVNIRKQLLKMIYDVMFMPIRTEGENV